MTRRKSKPSAKITLPGNAFMAAYKLGCGAAHLYDAVKDQHKGRAPFASVKVPLGQLADRIAWRLVMAGTPVQTIDLSQQPVAYPDLHRIETTALLALIFEEAPTATYDRKAPGATFWNWWDWAAGDRNADASDNRMTDLPRDERLAAGAAALAVLNARAAMTLAA